MPTIECNGKPKTVFPTSLLPWRREAQTNMRDRQSLSQTVLNVGIPQSLIGGSRLQVKTSTAEDLDQALSTLRDATCVPVVLVKLSTLGTEGVKTVAGISSQRHKSLLILMVEKAELEEAVEILNQGLVSRVLVAPHNQQDLDNAVVDACERHSISCSEAEVWCNTLGRTVSTLLEMMNLAHPNLAIRGRRVADTVVELCGMLDLYESWELKTAAALSQLGLMILPPETVERVCRGRRMAPVEAEMVKELPHHLNEMLEEIPRFSGVRKLLIQSRTLDSCEGELAAEILWSAVALENLFAVGFNIRSAVRAISEDCRLTPRIVFALNQICEDREREAESVCLPPMSLQPGMIFLDNIFLRNGNLFASSGSEITLGQVRMIKNLGDSAFSGMARVGLEPVKLSA